MANYGDKYLFTFEVRAGKAAEGTLLAISTAANSAATAVTALANAWAALNIAMGKASNKSININQVTAAPGSSVTNVTAQGAGAQAGYKAGSSGGGSSGGGYGSLLESSHLVRHAVFAAEAMAIYAAYEAVTKAVGDWFNVQSTLDQQFQTFRISMRDGARDALIYRDAIMSISKATGISPLEVGNSYTLQERVLGAPKDLAYRAAQVQRITGVDNESVTRDLLSLTKQFPDKSTVDILDAFIGAMTRSTLKADEFFNMLESAGPLTKQFNTSMEVTLGMFAGISTAAGESGSSIELFMRQMERVYTEESTRSVIEQLTGKPTVVLNPATGDEVRRPIQDIMGDIAKLGQSDVQKIAETIPNMLGQQTRQLFLSMVRDWNVVLDAIGNSQNAQGAWENAFSTATSSFQSALTEMESAWQRWLASIGNTKVSITVVGKIESFFSGMADQNEVGNLFSDYADKRGLGWRDRKAEVEAIAQKYTNERLVSPYKMGNRGTAWNNDIAQLAPGSLTPEALAYFKSYIMQELAAMAPKGSNALPYGSPNYFKYLSRQVAAPTLTGLPKLDQFTTLPQGVGLDRVMSIYNTNLAAQRQGLRNLTVNGEQPFMGASQKAIDKQLGVDTQSLIVATDATGAALGTVTVNTNLWTDALSQAKEEAKSSADAIGKTFQLKAPRSELTRQVNGVSPVARAEVEYERRIQNIINSAVTAMPDLAGKSRAEILKFAGVSEQYVTLVDDQGNVLRRVAVDLGVFGDAVEGVGIAARQLEYDQVPDGWSSNRYFSQLQEFANGNMALRQQWGVPVGPISDHIISTQSGTAIVKGDKESITQGQAQVGQLATLEDRRASEGKAAASKQQALLERIAKGIESFALDLLEATPVTEADISRGKLGDKWNGLGGPYQEKWDEPVRRVRDVVERRKGMNPDLGPWKGYAEGLGIDTSSIDATIVSGAEFERRFYGGLMPQSFYETNSKAGFLASAKQRMEENKGKENLKNMAMGWLDEAGISGDLSKQLAREFSGDISPMESYWRGGKTDKELKTDLSTMTVSVSGGVTDGFKTGLKDSKPIDIFVDAFDLKSDASKASLSTLGKDLGNGILATMSDTIADAVLPTVAAKVTAAILAGMPH